MKMYRVSKYRDYIECIGVERFNDHSVWMQGERRERYTEWGRYYVTWVRAYDCLCNIVASDVDRMQKALKEAMRRYERVVRLVRQREEEMGL